MKSEPPKSSSDMKVSASIPRNFIPWKMLIGGLILFLGGSGFSLGGMKYFDKEEKKPAYFVEHCAEQTARDGQEDEAAKELGNGISTLSDKFTKFELMYIKDLSRREALRALEGYKATPQKKAEKFLQLYRRNVNRLSKEKPREPCADWRCSN